MQNRRVQAPRPRAVRPQAPRAHVPQPPRAPQPRATQTQVQTNTEENKESNKYLLALRTAFYQYFNESEQRNKYKIPEQNETLGERPFVIHLHNQTSIAIEVQHSKHNTIISMPHFSSEVALIMKDALIALSLAHNKRDKLNDDPSIASELTFSLHVENLEQLPHMIRIAKETHINVTQFYMNGTSISNDVLNRAFSIINNNQTPAQSPTETERVTRVAAASAA